MSIDRQRFGDIGRSSGCFALHQARSCLVQMRLRTLSDLWILNLAKARILSVELDKGRTCLTDNRDVVLISNAGLILALGLGIPLGLGIIVHVFLAVIQERVGREWLGVFRNFRETWKSDGKFRSIQIRFWNRRRALASESVRYVSKPSDSSTGL